MLVVRVTTEPSFVAEAAVELFDGPCLDALGRYYDVGGSELRTNDRGGGDHRLQGFDAGFLEPKGTMSDCRKLPEPSAASKRPMPALWRERTEGLRETMESLLEPEARERFADAPYFFDRTLM